MLRHWKKGKSIESDPIDFSSSKAVYDVGTSILISSAPPQAAVAIIPITVIAEQSIK